MKSEEISPNSQHKALKIIAIFKLTKSAILLAFGITALFFEIRNTWLQAVLDWCVDEIMLPHGKIIAFLLAKFTNLLLTTNFTFTGIVSLIYAAVLATEGIGVYLEKRWAEYLMVIATASLIPFEMYHFFHKPSIIKTIIILVNITIVWFLFQTLKKKHANSKIIF